MSDKEKASWQTYEDELIGKDTPEMEAAVNEYAKHRYEDKPSSQTQETLAEWKEGNREISKQYQWVTPEEYADVEPRIGRIMHYTELINLLRNRCKLQCFYREMGHPQKIALWAFKRNGFEPELGCWIQSPYCPEYSIMRFDERGIPLDERYRGWRTVLMQLAIKGFLSEKTITKVFGRATGPASEKYNAFMQSLRQNGLGIQ